MKTIYKFPLIISDDVQFIEMPGPDKVLHVGLDPSGLPCVWAQVNPGHTRVQVRVRVFGTGHALPNDPVFATDRHAGSFVQGPFVWHVFASH